MNLDGENRSRQIIISDDKHGLPYSKGLTATSIMATGLPPTKAYRIARLVQQQLVENSRLSVKMDELRELTYTMLLAEEGKDYANKYRRWQALRSVDRPIIVLIGGTTGVGKSTVATTIAHRLGITHVVPTDALREVMRAVLSQELVPTLHESSFLAWKAIRHKTDNDPLIAGFLEQVKTVAVGVRAVIDRSITEGLNVVIEGVHIVPGFINSTMCEKAFVVPMIITVEDEDLHRSHFYIRELQTEGVRPFERYRENFDWIRTIGEYISEMARDRDVALISSHNLDTTITSALEEVLDQVLGPEGSDPVEPVSCAERKDIDLVE
ncbi:MAG TPA: hypothetical protein VGK02_11490 [Candidatus Aquicultor sp.]